MANLAIAPADGEPPKKSKAQLKKEQKKAAKKEEKANAPPKEPKAPKAAAAKIESGPAEDPDSMFKTGFLSEVFQERAPVLAELGMKNITTRFPPEPNGFLHIGHSKAIAINFGFARYHGGECYLRFDDTNPKGEEEKYFVAIEEMVRWLGFKPKKVTYSSDNFDKLYELAEKLIEKDGAYVCHCNKAEIIDQRGGGEGEGKPRYACPHRDRPIEESLTEFRAMRDGKYAPGEAALRMKQNLEDGNPQMWDLFAYRILAEEDAWHPRTQNKWRIYPTYDFTHCLCDSFEDITHSLCTTEFELSRVSYEWLCDKVEVYKPMQREYGRLNISGTVLSKRKIIALVAGGYVKDWDDPRLYTLIALRRRGVPPGAILSFVNALGVTKAPTNIEIKRFEFYVRRYLETTVPRLMLVLDPVEVVITNLPDDHLELVTLPFSKNPAHGEHAVPFTKTVYIERADFRAEDSADYFRLAPGKSVGLMKVPFPITATSFDTDASGAVTRIHARYENDPAAPVRPKTFIHWVAKSAAHSSPVAAEVRIFNPLFLSANPNANPKGFLADINPDSMEVFPNAMLETGFAEIQRRAPWPEREGEQKGTDENGPETVRFQGMRVAYFCTDKDTTPEKVVLNRIVSLKEDAGKA
ncbi:glutaminyl-tRNA synthetase [Geopyxis carbonaria]|nr:glutaminyl-tRNA synthetase [Geopyxis carbonaria]